MHSHDLWHIFEHSLTDTLVALPFLFLAYLLMEAAERYSSDKMERTLGRIGKAGPLVGAALGCIPQCGFSASASNLYAAGLIGGNGKAVILCVVGIHAIESILVGAIPYDVIVRIHGRPGRAIITIDCIGLALTLVCAGLVDHTDLRTCAKGGLSVCSVGDVIEARIGSI